MAQAVGSSQYPYYGYGSGSSSSGSSSDKSSPTTDSNGNCKSPEIRDGMAYVYPLINGVCTQKAIAEANVYKKQNTSTCPNKTDYENMAVSIGEEQYAIIDDTEYRVKSCYYTDTISLQSTTENCTVIPDYDNKQGRVQKQYWYILNNERVNIGSCVPTGEIIAIYDDDYNSCQYRFDFENGKAIKQTQWYYLYENKKKKLGECVDVSAEKLPKMTYPMYENAQGCECNEVSGVKLCQTKLSFNGIGNTKEDATECRYIDTEGVKLIDEFVGNYSFKDDSRQAVKKINQYFIGEGGERVYVTKDKETNKSYPYKEMSCGWEHINGKKLSYHKTKFIIKDPELLTLSADILSNNQKIQGDEYEIKGCEAVVQSVLYWQQQLELAKGKKTGEHKRQVLVPEELSETAKRWSLPMIKTKNSSGVQIEAMLEDGEVPIWNSCFKGNFDLAKASSNWGSETRCQIKAGGIWYGKDKPNHWNYNYNNDQLKLKGVDNLPESFSIGWQWKNFFVYKGYSSSINGKTFNKNQCSKTDNPFETTYCDDNGYCNTTYYNKPCELWESREVSLNNPFTATSNMTHAYTITLDKPIVIKPTKIDMDEHITTDTKDTIFYKTITKEIIDPNTQKCVQYPESEFVLDNNGKKQCVGKQQTEEKTNKPKVDSKDNPICDEQGYQKHKDWNPDKKGQCKTQDIRLFTTGVTFTPNYDESPIDMSNQYCKAGEIQTFESIEEKAYGMPDIDSDDAPYETDENGNAIEMTNRESSYYKLVESIKKDAMNVDNYSKRINKILCTNDNDDTNKNAYIIGTIMNLYHSTKLTKLEIESLKDLSMSLKTELEESRRTCGGVRWRYKWKWRRNQWLNFNLDTKKNWANNQTIYEHEMYRPFRRPDGSVFYLYERQGFFTQDPKVDCPECARDDELNG